MRLLIQHMNEITLRLRLLELKMMEEEAGVRSLTRDLMLPQHRSLQINHCAIFTFRLNFYTETQRFYFLLNLLEREPCPHTDVLYLLLFLCFGYFDFAGVKHIVNYQLILFTM